MRKIAISLIKFYAYLISPLLGNNCRFHPSCSQYAIQAIEAHGTLKGIALAIKRLSRCHPWGEKDFEDPVPDTIAWKQIIGYKRAKSLKR